LTILGQYVKIILQIMKGGNNGLEN
jgi:hypothetical protein